MNINKDGYSWVDVNSCSVLLYGGSYVARININVNADGAKSFSLDFSVEHTNYYNHTLNSQSLEAAKLKAEEIVASEYEKIINRAKATLEKYEGLAENLTKLHKVEMEYNSPWGSIERVVPKLNCYANNDNLYLGLDFFDKDCDAWLPYTDVTVNVGSLPYLESAIDTNNNGDRIVTFLEENGFGCLTGRSIESGYCSFPVFKFNEDKLKEIDSENFALYAKAHGRDLRSLDNVIDKANELKTITKSSAADKVKEAVLNEPR